MSFLTQTLIRLSIFCLSLVLSSSSFAVDLDANLKAYQQGNYQAAFDGWNNAAQQGSLTANYYLGELYRLGRGVKKNNLAAESYYIKAAQKNHPLAQLNLGKMYYFGELGSDKKKKAFYWLSKAAKQNNPDAQWMIGGMLFNGEGIAQDSAAAYSWLTLANDQDHLQAALNLARIKPHLTAKQLAHANNLTSAFKTNNDAKYAIIKQEQEAFYWFHKAAEQSDAHAQLMVGKMFLNGQGVEKDSVKAYSWLTLASEKNKPDASVKLIQLKSELSDQQISLANNLTAAFKRRNSTLDATPTVNAEIPQQIPQKHHYRVQVASFRSQLDVEIEVIELRKQFPKVMSEYKVTITEPNFELNKPDFYRIQLGNFNVKNDAKKLCQSLKKNKQACFIVTVHGTNTVQKRNNTLLRKLK